MLSLLAWPASADVLDLPPPPTFVGARSRSVYENENFAFNSSGVIMSRWPSTGVWYYNPGTIAQYAVALYGAYYRGDASAYDPLLQNAQWLYYNGQWKNYAGYSWYVHPYPYGDPAFATSPGWVSGFAAAEATNALWIFGRLTGSDAYYQRARDVRLGFDFATSTGGYRSAPLAGWHDRSVVWFEEAGNTGILNGHMYALLALDWYATNGGDGGARRHVNEGLKALEYRLHRYDNGAGCSYYDLGLPGVRSPAVNASYHYNGHVPLLEELYRITGQRLLETYRARWAAATC